MPSYTPLISKQLESSICMIDALVCHLDHWISSTHITRFQTHCRYLVHVSWIDEQTEGHHQQEALTE